jgi:hypothetical protein
MAVTEAGQFPFYSKWKAIDVLGLNVCTSHEGISERYLDRYQPELMMYYLSSSVSYPNFVAELHEVGEPIGPTKEDKSIWVMINTLCIAVTFWLRLTETGPATCTFSG